LNLVLFACACACACADTGINKGEKARDMQYPLFLVCTFKITTGFLKLGCTFIDNLTCIWQWG